ncbi:hypothetical protein AruPA_20595, partial [Acidiphilium sp. PA]|uniref:hypothetical protein n=1 Tax=Acidiphilium sp. PA TaxID=2871705 RepID=UPI00224486D6
ATVACSRSASKAICAFSAASIFRLVLLMFRSVYHDKTAKFQLRARSHFPRPLQSNLPAPPQLKLEEVYG